MRYRKSGARGSRRGSRVARVRNTMPNQTAAPRRKAAARQNRIFINAGCGSSSNSGIPAFFHGWREIRVDIDPGTKPDVVASIVNLGAIPDATADAVWSAHCVEHLYFHEVPIALAEFRRVLKRTGFTCIVTPDLQAIGEWISHDRLHESIYVSPSGPVSAHDMIWGFGRAIANGKSAMAHRCGFTPTPLIQCLQKAGFSEVLVRRRSSLELVALGWRQRTRHAGVRSSLMSQLGF